MDAPPRLKAEIWVKALIRRCEAAGAAAMVVRRGDATAGVVLVKVNRLDGRATVYAPPATARARCSGWPAHRRTRAGTGCRCLYREAAQPRPDLWVVEIEDREGRHFLQEKVS